MTPRPFTVEIPQATLDDLRDRLSRTRWAESVDTTSWDRGTSLDYLKSLTAYWREAFDWRAQEAGINRFAHVRTDIDGLGVHFIHERGTGSNPIPLLLLHGWPDSFHRMHKIIPLLTDPASHGGDASDSFDIVVPSIPGYGFSDPPSTPDYTMVDCARLLGTLMTDVLGYERFAVHGGDIGSSLTETLARSNPAALIGIHMTDIPYHHLFTVDADDLSDSEREYLQAGQAWQMQEGAYALAQSTKPQSLAQGLTDSPSGLAAWLVENFRSWSDCGGDVERRFAKDELLTHITLYWATGTIGSSFWPYYAEQGGAPEDAAPGRGADRGGDLPPRPRPRATRIRRTLLQHPALDGDAARRPFRRARRARAAHRRSPRLLS